MPHAWTVSLNASTTCAEGLIDTRNDRIEDVSRSPASESEGLEATSASLVDPGASTAILNARTRAGNDSTAGSNAPFVEPGASAVR
jgi:hypothetical protein